jgi:MSHA biogenesis protein MshI
MKFSFRPPRSDGWLALRQRGGEIDAARVERRGGDLRVSLCETYRTEGSVTASLTRLRREKGWRNHRCTALLGSGEYQFHNFEAPKVPPEELKSAARWRVKELIDYPLESAAVDILDIPVDANARSHSVFAVSARNEVVQRYVRSYQDAGIPLAAIDIPEIAQRNISALFEEENRGLAFLAFEETGGLLTITYRGELYLTRKIDVPLAKLLDANVEARAQLHERIALEVQRSLDHFDRQFSFITLSRVLLAPLPAETGLADHLAANIYVRVERADIGSVIDCAGIPELSGAPRQAFCLQILGAALRAEERLA